MIHSLSFKNYRKFENFTLRLRSGNILVGPNNSGKSSVLDAFRILEACFRQSKNRNPHLVNIPGKGVFDAYEIGHNSLPFSLANITTNYTNEDAVLEFTLDNKTRGIILLHPDRSTRFYVDAEGKRLNTSSMFRRAFNFRAVIVPTLAPLEAEESWVNDETVRRNAGTRLASRVLRNNWLRRSREEFETFNDDVKSAWDSIELTKPEIQSGPHPLVQMFYTENRMTREVQWAGFGFQVWLQILTHLTRGDAQSLLIIDEPDIYLHPDLQRRLLRLIRARFPQFLMATHSVEIINDAQANEVISIGPKARSGKRINSEEDYAAVYKYLGSADNADFARIARVKRVIFVEGRDGKILRRLASRLGFNHLADLQGPPTIPLGGFSNSPKAAHAIWAFKEVLDVEIEGFCLFDRDYRCDEQIARFLEEMSESGTKTMVLERKEIENYLLVDIALQRAIAKRIRTRKLEMDEPNSDQVREWLLQSAEVTKVKVSSQRAAHYLQHFRDKGDRSTDATLIERAVNDFEKGWGHAGGKLKYAPGKEILSNLNEFIQSNFGVSVSDAMIIEQLNREMIDANFLEILQQLDSFCEM
jgi:hypothetical protein